MNRPWVKPVHVPAEELRHPNGRPVRDPHAPTARELDVLRGVARGRGIDGTAADLGVTHDTVKTHLRNLYRGIGAANAPHAVHLAHERGWL